MKLLPEQIERFERFLTGIESNVRIEPTFAIHEKIIEIVLPMLFNAYPELKGCKVLDVGAGTGLSVDYFLLKGCYYMGTSYNPDEYNILRKKYCNKATTQFKYSDQSFMPFEDKRFDFIYSRHTLEHSFMPLYTLNEYKRVLKSKGLIYVEVPDTHYTDECKHECNPEHYSILTEFMWEELFVKSNLKILDKFKFPFKEYFTENERTRLVDCQFLMYILKNE